MSYLKSVSKENATSEQGTKTGRPNNWTSSRSRKLARLYLYSNLLPTDIPQALQEDDWIPGKESTIKTVSSLLDLQPRWLRPKDREEMEKRITTLSECKQRRKILRQLNKSEKYADAQSGYSSVPPYFELPGKPIHELPAFTSEQTMNSVYKYEADLNLMSEPILSEPTSYIDLTQISDQATTEHVEGLPVAEQGNSPTLVYTNSLKRRLTKYSSKYLMGISHLLRGLSISGTSATTTIKNPVKHDETSVLDISRTQVTQLDTESFSRNTVLLLASSLLVIDHWILRQGICIPGLKLHDTKSCWCIVAEELQAIPKLWTCGIGLIFDVADPPSSLLHLDLTFRDSFGNTALHFLAARGASFEVMMEAIKRSLEVSAVNTAGQTFLHVLKFDFFRDLVHHGTSVMMLLRLLDYFNVSFYNCDIFGVNFFHVLAQAEKLLNWNFFDVLKSLNVEIPSARNAFGLTPTSQICVDLQYNGNVPSEEAGSSTTYNEFHGSHMILEENSASSIPLSNSAVPSLANSELSKHARLLESIRLALDVELFEDSMGRNGLQCLAEASLTLNSSGSTVVPRQITKRQPGELNMPQRHPTSSTLRQEHKVSQWHSTPLTLRYELVQNMLRCKFRIDLNNYDKQGNTVLMSFVIHLCDGEDDKTLAKLLHLLIRSGADTNRRNRQGESALHIAIRLGRKIATRVLLENGANVHARTVEAKGVLAVGEDHCLVVGKDQHLYSSILACMALAIRNGAVAAPTLVQEWSIPNHLERT